MEKVQFLNESIEAPYLIALHEKSDMIFGLHVTDNAIFKFDIKDKAMRYVGKIPCVSVWGKKAFHSVVEYKELVFFIPFWEQDLVIYDCERKLWKKAELQLCKELEAQEEVQQREISNNRPGRFYGGCIYQDALFLFPFGYRGLVKYEIPTGAVTHCVDFSRTVLKNDVALFHNFSWLDEERIVLSCFYSNHIVMINLKSHETDIKEIGQRGDRFSTVLKCREDYWLVVKNRLAFIKWDPKTDCQEEYAEFPAGCEVVNDKHCFDDKNIYEYGNSLYCFPASCNMAVKFNLTNHVVEELQSMKKYCQDKSLNRQWSTFDGGVRVGDRIYLHYQLNKFLMFDLPTEAVEVYERKIKEADSIRQMKEDAFASFLTAVHEGGKQRVARRERTIGEKIDGAISELIL